jgi:hypothetical protein
MLSAGFCAELTDALERFKDWVDASPHVTMPIRRCGQVKA